MFLTGIPAGSFGRWSFGVIILTHLVAYNETGSFSTFVAILIAALNSLLMVFSKNNLNQLQMPYLRATHRLDFVLLFLALWMELLALVGTCAAITRTISFCLDAMSGGVVRLYILGRNSSIHEPWPDVLGVVIVFILSAMFILGLENSKVFSVLTITGCLSIAGLLAAVTFVRGNSDWTHQEYFPKGLPGILSASALLVISFPNGMPTSGRYPKLKAFVFAGVVLISISLILGCLSTLMQINSSRETYETVPILRILESNDLHKLIPAIGCLYVITCSSALLEVFTEAIQIVVRLAKSEWKILLKQISFESRDSGSPVLAVFVAGSLVAILAFTCPLQNMTYVIGGSHLAAGVLRAFYFLFAPFRPKSINPKQDSSQAYSRLDSGSKSTQPSLSKRTSMWLLNKASSMSTQGMSKSISRLNHAERKEEVEKEWLLLGEASSPVNQPANSSENAESSILSDATTSDIECIVKADNSESESDEDVDAIVEEFQQKVKVSTAGLKDANLKVPTLTSWKVAMLCIFFIVGSCITAAISASYELAVLMSLSVAVVFLTSVVMLWIPRYTYSHDTPAVLTCAFSLIFNSTLLSTMLFDSWAAISFWLFSGTVLALQSLIKSDMCCYLCLEYSVTNSEISLMEESLLPTSAPKHATATIRLKNPPMGSSVINHVQSRR